MPSSFRNREGPKPIEKRKHSSQKNSVVLSINPEYANKILSGQKTVELRRRFPLLWPEKVTAYIYATSPVKAMIGAAQILDVLKLPLEDIWSQYQNEASIQLAHFENYFSGLTEGYALILGDPQSLGKPFRLKDLQTELDFCPPQSFLYAKPELEEAMRYE